MPKYSIAICNYNMGDTLDRSLKSILEQTDEQYELLVVDDASTDKSPEILERLSEVYDRLRPVYLEPDPDRHLGKTRNISVRESQGDYILLHLDTDDVYLEGTISDFVYVFHELERAIGGNTVIQIPGIRMASREFLLDIGPYRNLPVGGEDMDFWRRVLADNAFVFVDAEPPHRSIGYEKTSKSLMKRWYRVAVSDFQNAITFRSYLQWTFANHGPKRVAYYLLSLPVAYIDAAFRDDLKAPPEFQEKGTLSEQLSAARTPLRELEREHGIEIDRSRLSENGRRILFPEQGARESEK